METNLTVQGSHVFSAVSAVGGILMVPAPPGRGIDGLGLFSYCEGWNFDSTLSNNALSGSWYAPSSPATAATFSAGALSSNGQAISGGSYSSSNPFCSFEPGPTAGTFTGYVVAPLNGTFTGTLTGTSSGPDQITIHVIQDSTFGVTVSGTSVQNGVTSNLSISPSATSTDVVGAVISAFGTETNINGSWRFGLFGHFNPAGTQITIAADTRSGFESGPLTKQ
ncbi:MAG TPA: hypothetical protein VK937_16415 [Candidatus Limnocylindria bacterium]|nr:hypothetical protein [Candidatus Limnocylindria bacterium]